MSNKIEKVAFINDKAFQVGDVVEVTTEKEVFVGTKTFIGKIIELKEACSKSKRDYAEIVFDCSANFESKIVPLRLGVISSATLYTNAK